MTITAYDPLGRPTTVGVATPATDTNKHRTELRTDLFGRLHAVLEYSGNNGTEGAYALYATTTYAYDGRDLLTGATDAAGNASTIQYGGQGCKKAMHDPDMGDCLHLQPGRHAQPADRCQGASRDLRLR